MEVRRLSLNFPFAAFAFSTVPSLVYRVVPIGKVGKPQTDATSAGPCCTASPLCALEDVRSTMADTHSLAVFFAHLDRFFGSPLAQPGSPRRRRKTTALAAEDLEVVRAVSATLREVIQTERDGVKGVSRIVEIDPRTMRGYAAGESLPRLRDFFRLARKFPAVADTMLDLAGLRQGPDDLTASERAVFQQAAQILTRFQ